MDVIGYMRVSTQKQGRSGLGLEAQAKAIGDYVQANGATLLTTYKEVESGRHNDRAELHKALEHCRLTGARLVIAKLDRLSRNAAFLLSLRDSGIDFVACDMPAATRMTVGIMAVMAEAEADMISQRTKAALQAAKARGQKLGCPLGAAAIGEDGMARGHAVQTAKADEWAAHMAPLIRDCLSRGLSLGAIARELTAKKIRTRRGKTVWHACTVKNLLARGKNTIPI